MARNKIQDLRDHLFETLEQLKDPDKPMDIERAKAIATVSAQIIESAKVEVKFMEVCGEESASNFIEVRRPELDRPVTVTSRRELGNGKM